MQANNAYEMLIRSVVDYAIFMLDVDGRIASWNPGAERIKGYTEAEIIGEHFSRFYTDEDRAAGVPERALRIAGETGRFSAEGWRQRKDGSRFWAMVVIDAIRRDDALIGFAKITRDITEQREAQLARAESERRFRLLVQGVTDYAIYMLDPQGCVVNWNAGAERIKGYREADILGQHFSRFYTPEDATRGLPANALATALREGRYEAEGWRVRRDGTRFWAGVVIDPIYDSGRHIGFAKITRDLTERRKAQLELEQSHALLTQSQKMDAVGQLTGGLAHDFNNLLTGISGSLELMRTRVTQGRLDGLESLIGAALHSAGRAASLTHRLLAFSRQQTLDPRPVQASQLVAGMIELVRHSIGEEIAIETRLAPGLWPTLCDPNQLENALLNLCLNARDAMPDGGTLLIETANLTVIGQHGAQEPGPGDWVVISVADQGVGMSEEVATRAFDPFFTTKPLGHGTGLGLSMVYGFTRQSGGEVRLRTAPGSGTTMKLFLPRYHGEPWTEQPQAPAPTLRADRGRTVLVIDDEPTVRMLIREVLEELGYAALEAADGASGMAVLRSAAFLDLLITDVGLPGGMNGRQVADAARALLPGLKVLFITGYAENRVLDTGKFEPGMHLLTKPFALELLATRIKELLAA